MQTSARKLLRIFLTGLLAALPLAATVAIVVWAVRLLFGWLGPESLVGHLLVSIGFGLTGSEVIGYGIGLLFVLAAIFGLGLLIEANLERGLARAVNALVGRIPLVRGVYDLIRRFVDLLSQREGDGLQSMSAVWCHFGGTEREGVVVLGLLSTPEPLLVGGRPCFAVVVPTAPVPVGGGLLYVPVDWVRPAEIGIEAVTSLYVSMGVTSAQYLPVAGKKAA
ncbi:DUF502 domain-containing protein [Caldimonas sp. KR1-144]|uniref:DUF502 domain-containing protein n=1 Tax=Caldimonas sp. KR1-144 TaxID=3400911 RepID=UPI003C086F45